MKEKNKTGFVFWVENNCEFTPRTAQNYMKPHLSRVPMTFLR